MLLAAVRDTPYNIVLTLHILAIVAAFAPAISHPALNARFKSLGPQPWRRAVGFMGDNSRKIYAPALILVGIFGIALIPMSDGAWSFADGWISGAFVVWFAMNGVLHGVVIPAERKVGKGDDSAESRIAIGGAVLTVLLLVMLWLMIWKPGGGA